MSSFVKAKSTAEGQNKTKVGLKAVLSYSLNTGMQCQNKTKVGLKERSIIILYFVPGCQNKTKVGLKVAITSHTAFVVFASQNKTKVGLKGYCDGTRGRG